MYKWMISDRRVSQQVGGQHLLVQLPQPGGGEVHQDPAALDFFHELVLCQRDLDFL